MNVIMIGFNVSLFQSLESTSNNIKITVVEEPDLYHLKNLKKYNFSILKEVLFSQYQQSELFIECVKKHIEKNNIKFSAVIPGLEYATSAAIKLADELNLPSPRINNPSIFSNKILFREHCKKYKISQPMYRIVKSQSDITDFFVKEPIVLKPANRQASLGVIKIDNYEKISEAWAEVQNLDEKNQLAQREMEFNYLVEECVFGEEISTEVFIEEGKITFLNFTDKITTKGKYSVELGHTVPSINSKYLDAKVRPLIEKLLDSLNYQTGFLHIEWIITDKGPKIIECAGRPPGDQIFKLIKIAYGFDPYLMLINALSGNKTNFPVSFQKGASIRFFDPKVATIKNIGDLNILNTPNIVDWKLKPKKTAHITEFKSSWDRIGYIIIEGSSPELANKSIENINKLLEEKAEIVK